MIEVLYSMSDQHVAKNILRYRRKRRMSQTDVAIAMGKTKEAAGMVCHWEKGRRIPSVQNLIELASALRTSLDELVSSYAHEANDEVV
jgi:transcriptional regulator with XRE-family HTH domain